MEQYNVALLGNPNSGKTSLFNQLTGLNQKVGNFSGVTVEKSIGTCTDITEKEVQIIDLPGTYSLYPKSEDERVVLNTLLKNNEYQPDALVIIVDVTNLKRNLLLLTQVSDLGIPCLVTLNMNEQAKMAGIEVDIAAFEETFGLPTIKINARNGNGLDQFKADIFTKPAIAKNYKTDYIDHLLTHPHLWDGSKLLSPEDIQSQREETLERYDFIEKNIEKVLSESKDSKWSFVKITEKVDDFLIHPFSGYLAFILLMFIIFQAVFTIASYPMDWIDAGVSWLAGSLTEILPDSSLSNLITEGIIPGVGGIVIFIPQIAFLLLILSVMEETGYMARVMFMMDKIMRKFGLNGRSVAPLVSATACAIPAILGTRSMENKAERLLTILVAPLVSCSARLPVYAILIALVIPDGTWLGFIGYKGAALFILYFIGFFFALMSALVLKLFIKQEEVSFFVLEVPPYRFPRLKNMGRVVLSGVNTFIFEAGKIILAVSIVLWILSTYGPGNSIEEAEASIANNIEQTDPNFDNEVASAKLEASYIGRLGKFIEPTIKPLGYNWEIGIALITSFAAREVFVGSLSTIYSVGESDDGEIKTLKEKLAADINPNTGEPTFNLATGLSLLCFYLFALQCISTLAVVKRETRSWKWPAVQFVYMGALAYISSLLVYNIFK